MWTSNAGSRRPWAFTLIELLIVVAIIAILAAIAVPNFLEAQIRARVTHAKSDLRTLDMAMKLYFVDYNKMIQDTIDEDVGTFNHLSWYAEGNPHPDIIFLSGVDKFYTYGIWCQLSTPVAYINGVPIDPFSKIVPFAYDTMGNNCCVIASCGPDRIAGHWFRMSTDRGIAIPYDPTNGTKSIGDLWRIPIAQDMSAALNYFPFAIFD